MDGSIQIGGAKNKGRAPFPETTFKNPTNDPSISGANGNIMKGFAKINSKMTNNRKTNLDSDEDEYEEDTENTNYHDKNKSTRQRLPKPGNKIGEPGFRFEDLHQEHENENSEKNLHGNNIKQATKSQVRLHEKSQQGQRSKSKANEQSNAHDEIFSIVYSVLNERHGGFNGNSETQRQAPPSYEILPSIDISNSARIFNSEYDVVGKTERSNQQSLVTRNFYKKQDQNQIQYTSNPPSLKHNNGGVEVIPARLISQTTKVDQNQKKYFSSSSNYQPRKQRPSQRRSGPNVEIIPVPLKHSSSSEIEIPQGESTNDQPYAIPKLVKDIKANNFILNYNPLLSMPTASRDEVLVQIFKVEDTYVNDGSGSARPISGANESNTKKLPSNFAQNLPGTPRTGNVTPFEITGGRPSSYDVPLNSVGPLEQSRTNIKSDSFKGYHY